MEKLAGLALVYLTASSFRNQGWSAIPSCLFGFAFSFFTTMNMFPPIVLGYPRAIGLWRKGQIRAGVFGALLIAPIFWFVVINVIAFILVFFFTKTAYRVLSNDGFVLSSDLGWIAALLSPLSKSNRAAYRDDFDFTFAKYFVIAPESELYGINEEGEVVRWTQ